MFSALQVSPHFFLTMTQRGKACYYPIFQMMKQTEWIRLVSMVSHLLKGRAESRTQGRLPPELTFHEPTNF